MPNNFTYNRNVPDGPNNPSDDQPDMEENTNNIDDLLAVDHVSFNTNKGGIHKWVRMPDQISNLPVSQGDGDGVLYALSNASDTWPIWRNTASGVSAGTFLISEGTLALPEGSTSLAGGIILKWGSFATVANALTPHSFASPFPTACFSVAISMDFLSGGVPIAQQAYIRAINAAGFSYFALSSGGTGVSQINYIAVGN